MTFLGVRFTTRELLDLAAAWLALSVAFAIFLNPGLAPALLRGRALDPALVGAALLAAGVTVGVGFLLHELGHKLLAVHYDQVAIFRANYGMLALAILAALAGWLFAAPGAVHHRGRLTDRQRGLIALAGPATNVGLAIGFLGLAALPVGALAGIVRLGVAVNVLLAGFNMLPVGPLDGRTVLGWSTAAYLTAATVTIGPAAVLLFDAVV